MDDWMLKCPFYWLTGYQCPLCGLQRAFLALLHLNIKEAWMLNPGLFIISPYIAVLLLGQILPRLQKSNHIVAFCYRDKVIISAIIYLVIWGVVRNLEMYKSLLPYSS